MAASSRKALLGAVAANLAIAAVKFVVGAPQEPDRKGVVGRDERELAARGHLLCWRAEKCRSTGSLTSTLTPPTPVELRRTSNWQAPGSQGVSVNTSLGDTIPNRLPTRTA